MSRAEGEEVLTTLVGVVIGDDKTLMTGRQEIGGVAVMAIVTRLHLTRVAGGTGEEVGNTMTDEGKKVLSVLLISMWPGDL